MAFEPKPRALPMRAIQGLVLACIVWRFAYDFAWFADSPFVWAPPSDGAIYDAAARDILQHPPWGTRPFYLQGGLAYVVALGLAVAANGLWLLTVLAWLGHLALADAARRLFGRDAGWIALLLSLALRAPWFYENKALPAALGLALVQATIWALVLAREAKTGWSSALVGCFGSMLILVRAEWLVFAPIWPLLVAMVRAKPGRKIQLRALVSATLVLALGSGAMMLRNYHVTGYADLVPTHGGGTSLYIGNNPHANGLWNHAGFFIEGRVDREVEAAGVMAQENQGTSDAAASQRNQAKALGDVLKAQAVLWIGEHPDAALLLLGRKLWLLSGNAELSQDYDWAGERELSALSPTWMVPLPLLFGLAWLGWLAWPSSRDRAIRVGLALAIVWVVATNLIFFTSSLHRLALAAPLVLLATRALDALQSRDFIRNGG